MAVVVFSIHSCSARSGGYEVGMGVGTGAYEVGSMVETETEVAKEET